MYSMSEDVGAGIFAVAESAERATPEDTASNGEHGTEAPSLLEGYVLWKLDDARELHLLTRGGPGCFGLRREGDFGNTAWN